MNNEGFGTFLIQHHDEGADDYQQIWDQVYLIMFHEASKIPAHRWCNCDTFQAKFPCNDFSECFESSPLRSADEHLIRSADRYADSRTAVRSVYVSCKRSNLATLLFIKEVSWIRENPVIVWHYRLFCRVTQLCSILFSGFSCSSSLCPSVCL